MGSCAKLSATYVPQVSNFISMDVISFIEIDSKGTDHGQDVV